MPSQDSVPRNEAGNSGQPGTGAWPGPLRHFADQLDELRSADVPDMDRVGRLLVELAADEEFFAPLIAQIPSAAPGSRRLVRPERGPRLVLVHRPDGVMGYTHSHRCWVGDVHNHGHVAGTGPSPHSLILLGDDMLLFDREEYDPEQGTWQPLASGDPGRADR